MTNTPDPLGLDKPETYQADPVLATLARRLAERDFATHSAGSIGRGALKQEYLEGKHAGAVAAALDEEAAKAGKAKAEADAKAAAQQAREDHLYRAYAEHLAMQEAWPYGARFHGEQYMAARPWYWVSGDGKTVRIVIVNLSGKEISKSCVVPADEFYARPKPNRITKAEAEWAFGKCGYRP